MVQLVKNLPANAGDTINARSIPESGDPLEEEMAAHSSILAWKIPWTEKPGWLQSWGRKESEKLSMHTHTHTHTHTHKHTNRATYIMTAL